MTIVDKLMFARAFIKEQHETILNQQEVIKKLSVELGKCKSEIDEFRAKMKTDKEEKKEMRKDFYVSELLRINKDLIARNKKLKKDNDALVAKIFHHKTALIL